VASGDDPRRAALDPTTPFSLATGETAAATRDAAARERLSNGRVLAGR
jgi:hypothetical protein